jgi:SynChlorMet cassette radical SAM/SPASM protein ScmF
MEAQVRQEPYLTDLLIYPTSRCNLKCRHCYFAPTYDDRPGNREGEISYEQICQAIDDLLPFGLGACKLSGGEPFLRDDLIGICCYLDSKDVRVIIETNGTLVKRHQADTLAQLRGDTFVSVSIDGAKAETHEALRGIRGCFHKVLQGLEHLVRASLNVQVIAAAYDANKRELPNIMELAAAKGAKSFRVCFVHAVGRARNLALISHEEALDLDRQLVEHSQSIGIRYCSSVPVGLKSVTVIIDSCALNERCNITSTLGILADGTISICGMGRYARDFRFGKLGEDNLAEVWMNHPTLKLIREGIPSRLRGICGRCVVRSACLGHCRIENENVTLESFFEPFVTCAELDRLELFPGSRIIEHSHVVAPGVA